MPIAETIAVISCLCSIVGATKNALELPDTVRKLKHAKNGRAVTPYAPAGSIVKQSDYDIHNASEYVALMERNVKTLAQVVHLQGQHMRNQVAVLEQQGQHMRNQVVVLEQARLLTDSQRELIVAHHGLLAQQWIIIEKAVWIIAYLAGALVSVSFLLASRSYYTGFYTFRNWGFFNPSYVGQDGKVNYGFTLSNRTFGLPSWMALEIDSIGDNLGNIAALILSIIELLLPFTAAPLLGLFTSVLIFQTLVPEFLWGELVQCLVLLAPALGYGLVYREFMFGHLAHDVVVSATCDTLLLFGIGSVLYWKEVGCATRYY
jgi:hypothetical protein